MITYSFLATGGGSQGVPAALSYSQEGKGKESPGRHFAGLLGCMEKVSYKIIVFFPSLSKLFSNNCRHILCPCKTLVPSEAGDRDLQALG